MILGVTRIRNSLPNVVVYAGVSQLFKCRVNSLLLNAHISSIVVLDSLGFMGSRRSQCRIMSAVINTRLYTTAKMEMEECVSVDTFCISNDNSDMRLKTSYSSYQI